MRVFSWCARERLALLLPKFFVLFHLFSCFYYPETRLRHSAPTILQKPPEQVCSPPLADNNQTHLQKSDLLTFCGNPVCRDSSRSLMTTSRLRIWCEKVGKSPTPSTTSLVQQTVTRWARRLILRLRVWHQLFQERHKLCAHHRDEEKLTQRGQQAPDDEH